MTYLTHEDTIEQRSVVECDDIVEERELDPSQEITLSMDEPVGRLNAPRTDSTRETTWCYYVLGELVREWGIGEIYEAYNVLENRPVWIKRLRRALRSNESARVRLEQEALSALRLFGPCVANVIDRGDDGAGGLFYAMEKLEGLLLPDAEAGGVKLSPLDVARLGVHLARVLNRAHNLDIRHLDLCPSHVFLHRRLNGLYVPKVLAFANASAAADGQVPFSVGEAYRPPEVDREPCGPGWDIYALGMMLSDLLPSGQVEGPAGALQRLLRRACHVQPSSRFSEMGQLKDMLVEVLEELEELKQNEAGCADSIVPLISPVSVYRAPALWQQRSSTADAHATDVVGQRLHSELRAEAQPPKKKHDALWDRVTPLQLGVISLAATLALGTIVLIAAVSWRNRPPRPGTTASISVSLPSLLPRSPQSPGQQVFSPPLVTHNTVDVVPVMQPAPVVSPAMPASSLTASTSAEPPPAPMSDLRNLSVKTRDGRQRHSWKETLIARRNRRRAIMRRATTLVRQRRYLPARRQLTAALRIWDSNRLRWLFSVTYFKQGKPWEAIHHLKRAVRLAPRSGLYRLKLGALYLKVRKRHKACAQFRFVQRANPRSSRAQRAMKQHCKV